MSNMNPQIQNGFNGGIWASLEGKVQSWEKSPMIKTPFM